jgi:hypothetical protein
MLEVLDITTPLDKCGYFIHTGYFLVTVIYIDNFSLSPRY